MSRIEALEQRMAQLEEHLRRFETGEPAKAPTAVERIKAAVAAEFKVSFVELDGPCRMDRIATGKHVLRYLIVTLTKRSVHGISTELGMTHKNVQNSVTRVLDRMETEPAFRRRMIGLITQLDRVLFPEKYAEVAA